MISSRDPTLMGGPVELFDLGSVLLGLLLGGAELLLHGDELIHEEVVLDALELEQAKEALGEQRDAVEARRSLCAGEERWEIGRVMAPKDCHAAAAVVVVLIKA